VVRRCGWRLLVYGHLTLALAVVVLTPDRPLWPAKTILSASVKWDPDSPGTKRAWNVYSVYARRADPLADVRALLPPGVKKVGFVAGPDDCDISLWLPLGSRAVEHFSLADGPERFRSADVAYAVVGGHYLSAQQVAWDDWARRMGVELVASTNATLKVQEGPQPWYVVRFK